MQAGRNSDAGRDCIDGLAEHTDNVIGRIPEPKELTKEARAVVQIHGKRRSSGKGNEEVE